MPDPVLRDGAPARPAPEAGRGANDRTPAPVPLVLPPRDHDLSPFTGLTRSHWEAVAEHLLLALRPWADPDGARILPPGRLSSSGEDSDGFEGFARSFLMAACLLAGRDGHDPYGHATRYADGIAAGTDPSHSAAWPRPATTPQTRVEAASLVVGLDLTRPWIWDRLTPVVRERTLAWLREVIGTRYPNNNWVWFRIVVLTFLRSEDPLLDPETGDLELVRAWRGDLDHDLALHESFAGEDGWFRDGVERAVDHYSTWAFPVFPALWLRMRGAGLLRTDGLVTASDEARHRDRLAAFAVDALGLVGADGGPLVEGRSLIYRAAVAAPDWAVALAGLDQGPGETLSAGRLRRSASGILDHFLRHGVPDDDGLLNHGWYEAFPAMAQSYSGPGSPYWIAMGFLGLALPAEHPVWCDREEPLPVERGNAVQVLATPGWIVSRRADSGIVQVVNHGTDHALPGVRRPDDPLYARLGYSTATSPPMTGCDAAGSRDQSVCLIHPTLGWSDRTGFETRDLRLLDERTAIGATRQVCHWPAAAGSPATAGSAPQGFVDGTPTGQGPVIGPALLVTSVVCDGVEVRLVRAEQQVDLPLAVAGWPLSGPYAPREVADGCLVMDRPGASPLRSTVVPLTGGFTALMHRASDVSPLGACLATPYVVLAGGLRAGSIVAAAVVLDACTDAYDLAGLRVAVDEAGARVTITWPDGRTHDVDLAI